MTGSSRLFLAEIISGITLILAVLYPLGFYGVGVAVRGSTILSVVLAAVAFLLALKIRAPLVAILLSIGGIIIWIPPLAAIIAQGTVLIPGPILGVVSFSPIFILGIVKLATSYRGRTVKGSSRILQGSTNKNPS
jgi:hypothetical protein